MKKLKLKDLAKINVPELMALKGGTDDTIDAGCDTYACQAYACKSGSCTLNTCREHACSSFMDHA